MRTHVVSEGETLSSIALRYYGYAAMWPLLFAENYDVIDEERNRYEARRGLVGPLEDWIFPGTTLRIP